LLATIFIISADLLFIRLIGIFVPTVCVYE